MPGTGFIPTPLGHPFYRATPFRDRLAAAGGTLIPLAQMPPFKRVWTQVPMIEQSESSACVGHAFDTAMMVSMAGANLFREPMSAWFLYTLINGGRDQGSSPGDAIDALLRYGICPDSMVPHGTIGPPGYNTAAVAAATKVRLVDHVQAHSFEEAVNLAFMGWGLCFDICSGGGRITTDSRGVAQFVRGPNDHEVFAGEQYRVLADGTPVLGGRNSWGTGWGVGGRCWWTGAHFAAAQEVRAIRAVAVDPSDPAMPPPLKGVGA